ncbi:MAG: NUDIX domain-containing protein [Gammaproteobacteria bacterium]|nr:NUDIX domain-containing protein [Gammaproteobacteria bacterium]
MNWPLHVTVASVVERNGKFLLVQETAGGKTVINQPAGHLEDQESLLDAVVRETLEETAWHFKPSALIGIYRWRHPSGDTFLRFCFTGELSHEEAGRALDAGIEQVLWLERDALAQRAEMLRSPLVLQCIDDYLAGQRIALSHLHDVI